MYEQRRLLIGFGYLETEPGNDPKTFILKVGRTVAAMKRAGLDVKEDHSIVAFISRLSHKYEMEKRTLDCEANLTRQKIEFIIRQRLERLQREKQKAGSTAFAAVGKGPLVQWQLC